MLLEMQVDLKLQIIKAIDFTTSDLKKLRNKYFFINNLII